MLASLKKRVLVHDKVCGISPLNGMGDIATRKLQAAA
jgi:hypothetical protein